MARLDGKLAGSPSRMVLTGRARELDDPRLKGCEVLVTEDLGLIRVAVQDTDGSTRVEWEPEPGDRASDDLLRELAAPPRTSISVVDDVRQVNGVARVFVSAYRYQDVHHWGELDVGVADKVLNRVRAMMANYGDKGDPVRWLTDQLTVPTAVATGLGARVVASTGQNLGADLSRPAPCGLRGAHIEASLNLVEVEGKRQWQITGVRSFNTASTAGLKLVHVDLRLVDRSSAAKLRDQLSGDLSRLAVSGPGSSFVRRWMTYQQLESHRSLRAMVALGYLHYSSWQRVSGDRDLIRFAISREPGDSRDDTLLHYLVSKLGATEDVQLEAAAGLPDVLGGDMPLTEDSGILDFTPDRQSPMGEVRRVDADQRVVELRMIRRAGSAAGEEAAASDPPSSGYLFKSYRGDYRRLKRRQDAMERIVRGATPMPHLLAVLEGDPRRASVPKRERPISAAVLDVFGGSPNEAQEHALDVAINTPDFAVIQGPPGTGKTELIAALQVRLAQLGRTSGVLSKSMLLTSFQHAAVDNLVERSKVWKLPAVKIDSRGRGSTAHLETWRRETVAALREQLARLPENGLAEAVRLVTREAAAYRIRPLDTVGTANMLARVRDATADFLDSNVLGELDTMIASLDRARRSETFASTSARPGLICAARALRYLPESFIDDGPFIAARLLAMWPDDPGTPLGGEAAAMLREAAEWTGTEAPGFLSALADLRGELLDLLLGGAARLDSPARRADVEALLYDIGANLDDRAGSPGFAVQSALLEYVEDLVGDEDAVLATLRSYTTSLGTTCQQSDSRGIRDAKDGAAQFDTVIVDEAGRANPLDLIIPLTMATRRIVLVGDHKQLPHMLEPDVEHELRVQDHDWATLLQESLFERLFRLFAKDEGTPRSSTLTAQYRMHPVLGRYVSDNFYDGQVESPRQAEEFAHSLPGYEGACAAWLNVPHDRGNETSTRSKTRPVEARVVAEEVDRLLDADPDITIGVITFYRDQFRLIRAELGARNVLKNDNGSWEPVGKAQENSRGERVDRIEVGTVDAFQGKQFDVVLLSLTRSSPPPPPQAPDMRLLTARRYGHVLMPNRLCVATSRQKRLLVVVGDADMARPQTAPPEAARLTAFWELCAGHPNGVVRQGPGGARAHP
ncbi:DEAD/DEAH box helicase [Amycolatopsis sp. NPDC003865]